MTILELLVVFCIGFAASFIGTNVGGSGLMTIPGLIFVGLPAPVAIATDQLGLAAESVMGWFRYHQAKKIDYKVAFRLAVIVAIGALVGAQLLVSLPVEAVKKVVAVVILAIGAWVIRNSSVGTNDAGTPPKTGRAVVGYLGFVLVGVWGGFFGAGFGLFARFLLLAYFAKSFLETAGVSRVMNVAVTAVAIPVFIANGLVHWLAAVPLILGMSSGSYVGASYGLKKGNRWLRRVFIVVIVLSSISLLL